MNKMCLLVLRGIGVNKILTLSRAVILLLFLGGAWMCNLRSADINGAFGVSQWITTHQVFSNGDIARGFVVLKEGFTLPVGGAIVMDITGPVFGSINLNDGTLELGGDLLLGTTAHLTDGGFIRGNGFCLRLTNSLTIPANETLGLINTGLQIDGGGNCFGFASGAKLELDEGVSLTLKNMTINFLSGDQIDLIDDSSSLTLQNVTIHLDGDFTFDTGRLFISKNVCVCGPHKFIYESECPLRILPCSVLCFDLDSTFRYNPVNGARDLVSFVDESSLLYFNNSTFDAAADGIVLTKGTLAFDNKVKLLNTTVVGGITPNVDKTKAITFGDGVNAGNDLNVHLLAGSRTEVTGYLDYNNVS